MLPLTAAVALLALGGALVLYLRWERAGGVGVPLAALRALAWIGVAALLMDPGCRGAAAPPTVLLDASLSMSDWSGDGRWRAAVDSARAASAGGPIVLFGERPRAWREGAQPDARGSALLPALRDAASRGGPVVIVTDGEVDDAPAVGSGLLREARIVVIPRPSGSDAGVAALRLPVALRAGDSATAEVDVVSRGSVGDPATLELREDGRVVARGRVAVGPGPTRATLDFLPSQPSGESVVRRYEARLTGYGPDVEPRDDAAATAAVVSRAAAVALLSESPDWDFRALAQVLRSARATPVRVFVRLTDGPWRDAVTLDAVGEAVVAAAARQAALLVVHGPEAGIDASARLARHAVWRWPTGGAVQAADWYVTPETGASPLGAALAGIPVESLPPLTGLRTVRPDSLSWTALPARAGRRGAPRPVLMGGEREGRRWLTVEGSGLWRWAARGGVATEAHRALVLGAADWLLEGRAAEEHGVLALRDSLERATREFLPRAPTLAAQAGSRATGARERVPLQQRALVYVAILAALSLEWVVRRRRGMR